MRIRMDKHAMRYRENRDHPSDDMRNPTRNCKAVLEICEADPSIGFGSHIITDRTAGRGPIPPPAPGAHQRPNADTSADVIPALPGTAASNGKQISDLCTACHWRPASSPVQGPPQRRFGSPALRFHETKAAPGNERRRSDPGVQSTNRWPRATSLRRRRRGGCGGGNLARSNAGAAAFLRLAALMAVVTTAGAMELHASQQQLKLRGPDIQLLPSSGVGGGSGGGEGVLYSEREGFQQFGDTGEGGRNGEKRHAQILRFDSEGRATVKLDSGAQASGDASRALPFRGVGSVGVGAGAQRGDAAGGDLRVTELLVPARVQLREGAWAQLRCEWQIPRSATLYSAKWYKDGAEFFRYMPDEHPTALAFPVPGVYLQEGATSAESLTLRNLTVKSGGLYRCEISTEGPAFRTAYAQQRMAVLSPPPSEPEVFGGQDTYSPGETVSVNCTVGRSHPPPQLTWYINGIKAERWFPGRPPAPLDDADATGLVTRTLPLRFKAERRLFQGPESRLRLVCEAAASGLRWTRVLAPALADTSPPAPHQTELREMPAPARPPPPHRAGAQRPYPDAAVTLLLPSALVAVS